ncbi:Uncharacterized beta-barrel protein YwiB, DUF1934 family [Natronincola ferrireducens]|uniref:Uncharacterized beta-barrel protein YwiB, DUF1934 family n=2 Tax=Natronincola ferrireducens TaxID=393762 RepID=A0A1G9FDQ3_9FIRM|nr:Uncharacterized beta-barrel protein YwiB, DUF1934 family [Natronincola ferrireducens]
MIKVVGIQKDNRGEENKIELVTEGTCYEKRNHLYIVYDESEISGMEGATTTLKIEEGNRVSMKRFGSTDLQMIFEEGKAFTSQYNTQFGNFGMEIFTKQLDVKLCDDTKKGSIEIHYDLWIEGLADTINELRVQLM